MSDPRDKQRIEEIASLRRAIRDLTTAAWDLITEAEDADEYTPEMSARMQSAGGAVYDARHEIVSKVIREEV